MYVDGLDKVVATLKAHPKVKLSQVKVGLKKAGLKIQREAQILTPVDTSDLRNSAGTRATGTGWGTEVRVYFGTAYAVYVHENLEARHAPGTEAKFLEKAVRKNIREIVRILVDELRR